MYVSCFEIKKHNLVWRIYYLFGLHQLQLLNRAPGREDRQSCTFDIFHLSFLPKIPVRLLRTNLDVRQCWSDIENAGECFNKVLQIFEAMSFNLRVKHHLRRLLSQPNWIINPFQYVIVTVGRLALIYNRWLWTAQSKSCS